MTRPTPRTGDTAKPAALKGGNYAAGWWGEEEAKKGRNPPGPYGEPPEVDPDAPDLKKARPPSK